MAVLQMEHRRVLMLGDPLNGANFPMKGKKGLNNVCFDYIEYRNLVTRFYVKIIFQFFFVTMLWSLRQC